MMGEAVCCHCQLLAVAAGGFFYLWFFSGALPFRELDFCLNPNGIGEGVGVHSAPLLFEK
ncbi:MAG: hypothetical protein LUE24_13300 [Lachnospiraceae bacterium]|nr:hypothetical protein [Lachnospiraceae bacterium]